MSYSVTHADGTTSFTVHDQEVVGPSTFPVNQPKFCNPQPVVAVNTAFKTFSIAGDFSYRFKIGFSFTVSASSGIDGTYTVAADSVFDSVNTVISVVEPISSNTAPLGFIQYKIPLAEIASTLTFVGKQFIGYGDFINENFLHLLENFASTSAPPNPTPGQLWYDTTGDVMKVWNGTTFDVVGSVSPDSPAFTGTPTAPTPPPGDNSTRIATTAFVKNQDYASASTAINTINSIVGGGNLSTTRTLSLVNDSATPGNSYYYGTNSGGSKGFYSLATVLNNTILTGTPVAPTAGAGTNTTQVATTAFVAGAVAGAGTIPNDSVTYAKIQNISAASTLLGRGSGAGAGDPQEISLGVNLRMVGTSLTTGNGADGIFYQNPQSVTANHTIPASTNAVSAGPITIQSGVTVVITAGSTWTIV